MACSSTAMAGKNLCRTGLEGPALSSGSRPVQSNLDPISQQRPRGMPSIDRMQRCGDVTKFESGPPVQPASEHNHTHRQRQHHLQPSLAFVQSGEPHACRWISLPANHYTGMLQPTTTFLALSQKSAALALVHPSPLSIWNVIWQTCATRCSLIPFSAAGGGRSAHSTERAQTVPSSCYP